MIFDNEGPNDQSKMSYQGNVAIMWSSHAGVNALVLLRVLQEVVDTIVWRDNPLAQHFNV